MTLADDLRSVKDHRPPTQTIPPLENGDRLTRREFERRYNSMPDLKKAELISGIVYMASPVRARKHGKPHAAIIGWLFTYAQANPALDLLDNATDRLPGDNEPQPDACLRLEQWAGGQSSITEDDYLEGPPELIVEIAASTASYDLHDKKDLYSRSGVKEYIVWRVNDRAIDWFLQQGDSYQTLSPEPDGITRSQTFPGLWLDIQAMLTGDLPTVLKILAQGMQTEDYQKFQHHLQALTPTPDQQP
ncbi:MAG: Uma2 family endonuclease [Alkalinema sp. RU_4_3]|nr:Uma2 family endonuclease [Alkalinema sp. RU_4_3]